MKEQEVIEREKQAAAAAAEQAAARAQDSVAGEIAGLKAEIGRLRFALTTAQGELAGWKQQASAAENTAKTNRHAVAAAERERAMAQFDEKEAAHRARMIQLMGKRRDRAALRQRFQAWKQEFISTRTDAQLADLERREAEAKARVGSATRTPAVKKWSIRAAHVLGSEEIHPEGQSTAESYTVYRVAVTAMATAIKDDSAGTSAAWEVGRRHSQFVSFRAALRAAPEVAAYAAGLKGKKKSAKSAIVANGGVDAPFPTKFSAGYDKPWTCNQMLCDSHRQL
eukprot:SAG31_NODE_4102_length_3582_cov_1.665518_3_plen_282_part_00